jgi:hypothetical protein
MNRMKTLATRLSLLALIALCAIAPLAIAQPTPSDVVTVGTVSGSGTVSVPVYIRDTSGTVIGIDQPSGSRIQSYSIRVTYPSPFIDSITFTRAGITSTLTPVFEDDPTTPTSVSLLGTFDETTNLIPFTSDATLPGDQIGVLNVAIDPTAPIGTLISFTLDPVLTQLTDEGGTPASIESQANGRLTLVNGSITVAEVPVVPTLGEWTLALLAVGLSIVALRFRLS